MAHQTEFTAELLHYVTKVSLRDDPILAELRELTNELPGGTSLQVMAEEAQLLALLVQLTNATTVLEIGTYTGYSALCMARALPFDGRLVTLDINPKWIEVATPYWQRAGVADRIEPIVGDAAASLELLRADRGEESFDLVFVDGDKAGYPSYYESALRLVRPGGLIVLDNTLFFGRVIDPTVQDSDTQAIRDLNEKLRDDDRVDLSLLVMADGITLARKRGRRAMPAR
ncbi:O-methyltransferase [Kitasatospora sp. NPDC051705]|uniref:O-methyltransferase n=1 Tax=Kitasatospora sp. NPDC051705 TaxID=3364057 RepID=UPI0037AD6D98